MRNNKEPNAESAALTDAELLALFQREPAEAWAHFIDRYADLIFALIRGLGFGYDEAMDRFVYVCEKLSEKDYRRLRGIKYAGSRGELTPWIRQVVKRLCISWAWSEEGRRRLLKPIQTMTATEQRVFELYFWQHLSPSQIEERLRQEHYQEIELASVYSALDHVLSKLSEKKLWRLLSSANRATVVSLDAVNEKSGERFDVADERPNPESTMIERESDELLQHALRHLPERQVLVLQFRFEHAMSFKEISTILRLDENEVRTLARTAMERLKRWLTK
jgi:DNA-directed RNA polymerase specialized sigma24 family protein